MKRLIFAAVAVLALVSCTFSSGNGSNVTITETGSQVTKNIKLDSFSKLVCSVPGDVTYEYGDPAVVICAAESVMEHIKVEQNDDEVTIKLDVKTLKGFKNLKIYVTSHVLSSAEFNGAVDFDCKGGLKSREDFSLVANGAADVDIKGIKADNVKIVCNGAADVDIDELRSDAIDVTVNGAANVTLAGRSDIADLTINGVGDIDITELESDKVLSSIHGLGSISGKKEE